MRNYYGVRFLKNIDITADTDNASLYAMADPHQLESAILNLALNAWDAMPEGTAVIAPN